MKRYHVNPETGNPGTCTAKISCPFGDLESDHYPSRQEAQASFEKLMSSFENGLPLSADETIQTHPANRALTPAEFHDATAKLSDAFSQEHWDLLNSFYDNYTLLVSQEQSYNKSTSETIENLVSYLESDDETAVKTREYLGPEINLRDFSTIIVKEARAMTASVKLRNSRHKDGINRIVLTSVANDMNKRRYIASVLYFGGRCCYCNSPMSKEQGPRLVTGEHITPLSPEKAGDPVGATRYGNMALACYACNHSRRNIELNKWIDETDCIPESEKANAKARIQSFRRFALYEEYSPEASKKLRDEVAFMRKLMESKTKVKGLYSSNDFHHISTTLKARLYDLRQELDLG